MNYASSCILWHVTLDDIHITGVPEANYTEIQKKWKKHLPLGKKTGNPLEDVKLIFPAMFNGQVGLFEEASLKLSPEAKLVQLPPRAMPQSILPKLRKELDKMKTKWIFQTCPETTDWVHNLVTSQEEWYTSAMPRPQKSEQASHQKCALHRVMGRCTAQLQEWTVLLNSWCNIRILDETSQREESATHCLQLTIQEIMPCRSPIRTVSIIGYLLQAYGPSSRRHTWNIPMCGWRQDAGANRRTRRPPSLGNCSKGTESWS